MIYGYTRVSTEEQADGTSLATQRTMIQGVDGALKLELVQRPGKKPQPIAEFLRGFDFSAGNPLM